MRKHKHFKVKDFLNFSREAEYHAVPKTWYEWIPMLREKYEKTQTFQLRVSYIFHMKQKSIQFPNCGMSEFSCYGTSMEKPRQFPGSALH